MVDSNRHATSLEDFPLHGGSPAESPGTLPAPRHEGPAAVPTRSAGIAPLGARTSAAAADAAAVLLLVALAILSARVVTGESPRLSGIPWAMGFLLYLSLFATVPPLVLFGRTVGMALADLSTRSESADAGLSAATALRRWIGTLATVATVGLPLLWTARHPNEPTPADRLSGRPLTVE